MQSTEQTQAACTERQRSKRARRVGLALLVALVLGTVSAPVRADDYDPKRAGNPVRIVAYALHPVGVIADYLLMRPAHWLVHHEPFRTLFGHD